MFKYIKKLFAGREVAAEERPNNWPVSSANVKNESSAATNTATLYDDPEIQIIAGRYGELVQGKVITTTLAELEEILPRPRRRADAYATVTKRLAAMGVTLVIKREVRHDK
jgi:hypothetical protein